MYTGTGSDIVSGGAMEGIAGAGRRVPDQFGGTAMGRAIEQERGPLLGGERGHCSNKTGKSITDIPLTIYSTVLWLGLQIRAWSPPGLMRTCQWRPQTRAAGSSCIARSRYKCSMTIQTP